MFELTTNFHALLIGVGDYKHSLYPNLPTTINDVNAIEAILIDANRCGYLRNNVQVIIDEKATYVNIRTALKTLAQSSDSQSTVFIFFSGHGGRALEFSSCRTFLCPHEADPGDLCNTAISGDEFSKLIAAIPAQKMLVILDCCHAGGSAEFKSAYGTLTWKSGLSEEYYEALSLGSGRVVMASSKPEQVSFVRSQGDFSVFTWHLCRALDGKAAVRSDGLIHVLDVFHYVNEAVTKEKPQQIPILKVKDLDLNFPIALDLGRKSVGPSTKVPDVIVDREIMVIREHIVRDPVTGAKVLSDYLSKYPQCAAMRNEVDLRRSELEQILYNLDLFGPNDNDKAAKNKLVFSLLSICLKLEQFQQK